MGKLFELLLLILACGFTFCCRYEPEHQHTLAFISAGLFWMAAFAGIRLPAARH